MQLVRVSGKRVLRGLRSAESLESMTTNGNLKGALGNSNGGNHCVFCINRLCVCNPTFFGPLYGNNELLCWYLCHQPFISFDTLSPARWKSVTVHVTLINSDQAESFSPVPVKNTPRRIRFPVSDTSKSIGASLVVGKVGKDVFLRRTLAYSTTYGTGVFCLMEEGEQQID